ncbi:hypothetical protein PFY12_08760 [Chryseobacterium camelliae]|uniref:TonB C-terminal domain-containing protein n=1 Tax=Chryseobacterium camelliae TaxID=1265445 RepID=A0ABY7QIH9_9FLAO|nr:hypothetical protein [Chryseobacterium camelliae]WBV59154.1 hypothetical protein PFY12_08760 [Chryseobacterium camelliae]
MIRNLFLLMLLGLMNVLYAQTEVLERYPYGQDFYAGGMNQLKKEMVKIVKEQNLAPCEGYEKYYMPIVVYENATINYVKDFDTLEIQKNKCAFDFGRKIIPHLKRWIPAKENGKFIAAITKVEIQPFFLINSREDPSKNEIKNPVYIKGMRRFSDEVSSIFARKIKKNEDKRSFLAFVVNEKGEMQDFKVGGDYTESEKNDIIRELSKIKGKWTPATFNGIPLKYRLVQPLAQEFDLQMHIKDTQNSIEQGLNDRYR